jgi:hypothetical protein
MPLVHEQKMTISPVKSILLARFPTLLSGSVVSSQMGLLTHRRTNCRHDGALVVRRVHPACAANMTVTPQPGSVE